MIQDRLSDGATDPGLPLSASNGAPQPFRLLERLYADDAMSSIFSQEATVLSWLKVESALAIAQGRLGVIEEQAAAGVAAACSLEHIDMEELWRETRVVGYPILPMVRQLARAAPNRIASYIHFGATTQDIMDSGLALQLREAMHRLDELTASVGNLLCEATHSYRTTVMAGRTHGQHAVPTTFSKARGLSR